MVKTIEIEITPDGEIIIQRGSAAQNAILKNMCSNIVSDDLRSSLNSFLSLESDIIFGPPGLCG